LIWQQKEHSVCESSQQFTSRILAIHIEDAETLLVLILWQTWLLLPEVTSENKASW